MKIKENRARKPRWVIELSVFLYMILTADCAYSAELSEQQVQRAVETWVRHVTADAQPEAIITEMEPYNVDGKTFAYIAHLQGGGYCICGRDDMVLPVYLYNPHGQYDPQNPGCQYVLWEIHERTEALRKASEYEPVILQPHQTTLELRTDFWQDLILRKVPEPIRTIRMTLKLTSKWDQKSPYNDQCPALTPGAEGKALDCRGYSLDNHTVVGCTATAMAQIMYYWKWPDTGEGDATTVYERKFSEEWFGDEPMESDPCIPKCWADRLRWIKKADGGKLQIRGYWDEGLYNIAENSLALLEYKLYGLWEDLPEYNTDCFADFGTTTYRWDLLHDEHDDPPDNGDAEVAKLCYHAGVSIGMNYGVRNSGINKTEYVTNALKDHFRYDPDAVTKPRNVEEMIEEIQWLRPVLLTGYSGPIEGHAFVVYGYDTGTKHGTQFLMNMGWGGGDSAVWYTCDDPNLTFRFEQENIIRIAPKDVVKFVGNKRSGDGSPFDPYENIEQAIAEAPNGAKLIFKAGSINIVKGEQLVIARPFTLHGYNATIR